MTRIYYAHPKSTYNTELEVKVINWINLTFYGYEILNPSLYEVYEETSCAYFKAMEMFYTLIETCDLVICMGKTDGVKKEIEYSKNHNISVLEVPESVSGIRSYL